MKVTLIIKVIIVSPKKEYEYIDHMVIIQNDNFYFQKISTKHIISNPVLLLGVKPVIKDTKHMIILDSKFDAIYNYTSDILYFKNYGTLTSIFDGVTEYYKEATDEVVKNFLEEDSLEIHKDFNEKKVSKPNRKRIGILIKKMDSFNSEEKKKIADYIVKYVGKIKRNTDSKKLIINK